jgi:hypothetical protein
MGGKRGGYEKKNKMIKGLEEEQEEEDREE